MSDENAYLVLGCYGRTDDGFVLCPAIENRILKIDDTLNNTESIVAYLDAVQLFDRPMLDINAIHHLIYNLQDRFDQKIRRLWTEKEYHLLERFIQMHKPCGLYARLIVVPAELDVKTITNEPASVIVKGTPEKNSAEKKPELKLIRGRR